MSVVEVNGYEIRRYASLWEADLQAAVLTGADLYSANLLRANLKGANLSETDLAAANLTEAVADEGTKWPDGFEPEMAGVIIEVGL